jgi:D-arabinono-1,4-lactone oxidase
MHRREVLKSLALGGAAGAGACGGAPGPITRAPSGVEFHHPRSEAELIALVGLARQRRCQLRVRGSMHSQARAIFTDPGDQNINVQLDRYNRLLCWNERKMQVTVQAGIHLGIDPLDPSTTWENSLNLQLQERGWALPSLGGITHQTVGGFLSTGSSGGSLHHNLGASVVSLRIVAGDGRVYELLRGSGDAADVDHNPFYAAGVAMGLFGIISQVTFQCVPSYNVLGEVVTCNVADAHAPAAIYEDGARGLQQWCEAHEYQRTLLWPQRGVERMEFWSARRSLPDPMFRPKPFVELAQPLQRVASHIYEHVQRRRPPYEPAAYEAMRGAIKLFISPGKTSFRDYWYRGLPTDNTISDLWMPTEFTELFVDIDQTAELMRTVRDFWAGDVRMNRTGPYCSEIYATKESDFWLSPTFRRRALRIDFLWFKTGDLNPADFYYPQFWELLRPLNFRFHWGKHLSPADSSTGVAYRRANVGERYWTKWLQLRERYDPDQIFVTEYWRKHLGIATRPAGP